jgi:hypothetical protein
MDNIQLKLDAENWLECCKLIEPSNIKKHTEYKSYYYLRDVFFCNSIDTVQIKKEVDILKKLSREGIAARNAKLSTAVYEFAQLCERRFTNHNFDEFKEALRANGFNYTESEFSPRKTDAYILEEQRKKYLEERIRQAQIEVEQEKKRQEQIEVEKKKRTHWRVILLVFTVLLVGIVVFIYVRNMSSDKKNTTPQQTQSKKADNKNSGNSSSTNQRLNYNGGDYYDGEVKNDNIRHGRGKYFYANGNWLEGNWTNGSLNGQGTFYNAQDKRTDIGQFSNSKHVGSGIMTWANSDRYKGTWSEDSNGQINGQGALEYDGTSEKGRFVNGKWVKDRSADNKPTTTVSPQQEQANNLRRANAAFQKGIEEGDQASFDEACKLYLKSDKRAGYNKFQERAERFKKAENEEQYQRFINYANKLK